MTRRSTLNTTNAQHADRSARSARSALYVVVPGDLETRTGGYGYDRRIIAGLRDRGWAVEVVRLDDSFPAPTTAARVHAARSLALIPAGSTVLIDGLALGAIPDEVEREAGRLTIVALVHHPLAAETGLEPARAAALETSERRALAATRAVVVTSRATARALAAYGVIAARITVVEPGTDPARRGSEQTRATREVALLCVATLTPRKGHELLLRALASIPQRNWTLTCAGSLERDPATVARVRAHIRAADLEDRVSFAGELDAAALAEVYDRADLFVLPTLYEGYGMAVAEALARGIPVISTATGAIQDLVDEAGMVVPPGDLGAFTAALSRVLGDADLRARLAANARTVRDRLPTWDAAAEGMAGALDRARG